MKTRLLILGTFCAAVLLSTTLHAQALNPDQTVDLTTGQMSFSLPLGTVTGLNTHDFPINLDYHAGILYNEEASEAGLGFSFGPGGITRKVVFVPDDCKGGSKFLFDPYSECNAARWVNVLNVIMYFVTSIVDIFTSGMGGFALGLYYNGMLQVYSPKCFNSGGTHVPNYDIQNGNGKGFFHGGEATDLPDVYFVNTPYICGEMVWVGTPETGHFVMNSSSGAANGIIIDYDKVNKKFTMTLKKGTRLYFEERSAFPTNSMNYFKWNTPGSTCESISGSNEIRQKDASTAVWHLTKVLFNDFSDIDGDNNPLTNQTGNRGSWICFTYGKITNKNISRNNPSMQSTPWGTAISFVNGYDIAGDSAGEPVVYCHLLNVLTPNETAVYDYTYDRKDNLWHYNDWTTNRFVAKTDMPVLNSITVKNKNNTVRITIQLHTSYTLRPNNYWNYEIILADAWGDPLAGNPTGASLTLDAITLEDGLQNRLGSYTFQYGSNPEGMHYRLPSGGVYSPYAYFVEEKDIWGYYCASANFSSNDFNPTGSLARAQTTAGEPYAAAWSLKKIITPTGMAIKWNYESNRYDAVDNVQLSEVHYGGGIRVKDMEVDNGLGGKQTLSYIYTLLSADMRWHICRFI
jgi:hypothetical protein